ncbi:MAG: exo-alpha-sialidase [Methylohalobius sp. ZOD2]
MHSEFIFDRAPTAMVHASTLVETDDHLVAAWFGGTTEGAPDTGIWLSRHADGCWSPPLEAATGSLPDGRRLPCWNPVLIHSPQVLQLLCRSRNKRITTVWSHDGGRTWGRMSATSLPNPNSGIDAIKLADGRRLLIYNPTARRRNRLALALSSDGIDWRPAVTLEDSRGEYSYPTMIQTRNGLVHMTYTWKRKRIKHVVINRVS